MKKFLLLSLFFVLHAGTPARAHSDHSSKKPEMAMSPESPSVTPLPGVSQPQAPVFLSGRIVDVNLEIAEEVRSPAGSPVRALTINGTVPGPTIRFREGDSARIHVHNRLKHGETSLHWHGLLVPNDQDGVPHLNTPPIAAGATFTYEFPLRQSGTYWFHSHTGLQEQRGVFGSIVVEPRNSEKRSAIRDQVLLLSDWSNESPEEILRTLKRGSKWYGIKKGTAQSLWGAHQAGELGHYFSREKSRMPPMDVSDIAYDAFLVNGQRKFQVAGKPGETVRLRVINGSAATYFYLQSATGPLTIVAADGPSVQPTHVNRLLIGIAETYDLLVQIPKSGSWEIRATAQDGSGMATAMIGNGAIHAAPDIPKPNLYNHESMLKAAMEEADSPMDTPAETSTSMAAKPSMSMHSGPRAPLAKGSMEEERPLSPYRQLRALAPTTLPQNLPRRTVELHLTGDMQRYVWSFNGKTISEESTIDVKRGEILRMELVNDSMMHHPIHLHGHFFRLLNGQGDFAPLKHTVDVPPMGRRVIEFEANEFGDWMFHCHILYHMMEGMARVLHYEPQQPASDAYSTARPASKPGNGSAQTQASPKAPNSAPHLGEHAMPMHYAFADFSTLSNLSEGSARILSGRNSLLFPWEIGKKYSADKTEYETDLLYERYLNPNWGVFGGARLSNQTPGGNRPVAGVWNRLPYLVMSSLSVDGKGAVRAGLSKELQITDRFAIDLRTRYDTRQRWESAVGATLTLTKALSLSASYHSEYGLGAGLAFHF